MAAFEEGRLEDAIRFWEIVWAADPEYPGVGESLKREYLTLGIEAFASGRLELAVSNWEKVLRLDPSDDRASGYLARAHQQLSQIRRIAEGAP
jgi:cytochrome c-type biogenesis protein CcmH/NrfG